MKKNTHSPRSQSNDENQNSTLKSQNSGSNINLKAKAKNEKKGEKEISSRKSVLKEGLVISIKPYLREAIIVLLIFIGLTYFYLAPGSHYLFEGRTDVVLSDGTDPVTFPFNAHQLIERLKVNPSEVFYGAIYSDKLNPPSGFVLWFSWVEKLFTLLLSLISPLEQLNAGLSFAFIALSGLSMYALGRYQKWSVLISLGLGMSWGFNAFTLARSKVHPGLAALFFLPLLFIVFKIIKEDKSEFGTKVKTENNSEKGLGLKGFFTTKNIIAVLLLLFVAMTPQYFILISAFLSPFWLVYILLGAENKLERLKKSILIVIPTVLFMLWTVLMPVPPDIKNNLKELYPTTGEAQGGIHPFLFQFAADPIDYLSGNIGITLNDWNPIKENINVEINNEIPKKQSNNHEHAVGVRWLIILLSLFPLYYLIRKKSYFEDEEKKLYYFFYGLAVFSFFMSLSPTMFGADIGPSLWIHKLVSQVRVPSRASVFVHFSLLMIVGMYLQKLLESQEWTRVQKNGIKFLFPLLILLELPPVYGPPTYPIQPANPALEDHNCGLGMFFPYANGGYDLLAFYNFQQTLRTSSCTMLNTMTWQKERDPALVTHFGKLPKVMNEIKYDDVQLKEKFLKFVKCVPLEWVVFDNDVPAPWRQSVCSSLGWKMSNAVTCNDTFKNTKMLKLPEQCL